MTERRQSEQKSALERHIQTVLVTLITAGIAWIVSDRLTSDKAIQAAALKLEYVSEQIASLRAEIRLLQNNYVRQEQFADHEERMRKLEAHVTRQDKK
jgi:hypothetical protein